MELDAFTDRLGSSQGRVVSVAGELSFALGDLEPGRRAELAVGDYVEVAQTLDVTGVALVRALATMRVPESLAPGLAWEVSVLVDGVPAARTRCDAGRTRAIGDLAANVSKLTGTHEISVRLALAKRS